MSPVGRPEGDQPSQRSRPEAGSGTLSARERWNARYAEGDFVAFPDRPSEWLVCNRALLEAVAGEDRRALDVACGNGRNALYLARLGFAVDAVDVSDVAVDRLRAAAEERGLPVTPLPADLERDPLPDRDYDVVVNMNFLQRDLLAALGEALRPGGLLVFETLTRDHVELLGNAFNPDYLLDHNELLRAFSHLRVRRYREVVVERSGRRRAVASLVAQRP